MLWNLKILFTKTIIGNCMQYPKRHYRQKIRLQPRSSKEIIVKALNACDQEFDKLLKRDSSENECLAFCFKQKGDLVDTSNYEILSDFWNTIEPYVFDWPASEYQKFWIIKVIRISEIKYLVDSVNHFYNTGSFVIKSSLDDFCKLLDDMEDKEALVILDQQMEPDTVYSLKYFDEGLFHIIRDKIILHMIDLLKHDGNVIVTFINGKEVFLEIKNMDININTNSRAHPNYSENQLRKGCVKGFGVNELWESL